MHRWTIQLNTLDSTDEIKFPLIKLCYFIVRWQSHFPLLQFQFKNILVSNPKRPRLKSQWEIQTWSGRDISQVIEVNIQRRKSVKTYCALNLFHLRWHWYQNFLFCCICNSRLLLSWNCEQTSKTCGNNIGIIMSIFFFFVDFLYTIRD